MNEPSRRQRGKVWRWETVPDVKHPPPTHLSFPCQNLSPSKIVQVRFIFLFLRVLRYSNGHVSLSPYGGNKFLQLPLPLNQGRQKTLLLTLEAYNYFLSSEENFLFSKKQISRLMLPACKKLFNHLASAATYWPFRAPGC